jgi:hypothetical protein
VKQRMGMPAWIRISGTAVFLFTAMNVYSWGQSQASADAQSAAMASAIHDLQEQVQELRQAVAEIRSQAAEYRAQTLELRQELETTRSQSGAASPAMQSASSSGAPAMATAPKHKTLEERVAALEDSTQLLSGKVDDQYQTKIESASKYRVRLSGIVLMNLFSNRGAVDNEDVPSFAAPQSPTSGNGSFGATLRQSEIGLEAFGPDVAGARTSGSLQADFAGGFPYSLNGTNYGIFRLRTANVRLDWAKTSIIAGQDSLFISPNSPTSFASLAEPALSYAGNLWGWIPQVRVEHHFALSSDQDVTLQGGILDNATGEYPASQYARLPQAGERSGQPGFGMRAAWTRQIFGEPLTLGTAGYYSRQDWQFGRNIDGWAGMADWNLPLPGRLSFSGEFYRGRAIGGLGGGAGRSVLYTSNPVLATTQVYGFDSVGGWSQLKLKATPKLEFNAAFGLDNPYTNEARDVLASEQYVGEILVQNRGSFANVIYRPRSDLLLSTEYRYLRTNGTYNNVYTAGQLNMIMGIMF